VFNIVLVNPQIPNNTGAIGRICINTQAKLHLISPFGFDIDEKAVRRAGLDYWKQLNPIVWENWESFYTHVSKTNSTLYFATTKRDRTHWDVRYKPDDFLIFGSETTGLPMSLIEAFESQTITIPMAKEGRSLNLAVATSIVLYEAIRQNFSAFEERM